jgi:TRAP-type C4-dicarboxylate transport system substrate-binding protein
MSPPEFPDALKKGTVDGISSSYLAFNLFGHVENLNYVTEASLYLEPFVLVMNKGTWDRLPPDLRKLFIDSYKILPELYGYDFDQTDLFMKGETDKKFKARGMPGIHILPKEEMDRWKKAAGPIHEEWVNKVGAKIGEEKARSILEDAKKFAQQYRYETTPVDRIKKTLHDWGAVGH